MFNILFVDVMRINTPDNGITAIASIDSVASVELLIKVERLLFH
jgi:acyl carrier protein